MENTHVFCSCVAGAARNGSGPWAASTVRSEACSARGWWLALWSGCRPGDQRAGRHLVTAYHLPRSNHMGLVLLLLLGPCCRREHRSLGEGMDLRDAVRGPKQPREVSSRWVFRGSGGRVG